MTTFKWGMLSRLEEYKIIGEKFQKQVEELTSGQVKVELWSFDRDPNDPREAIESGDIDMYQVTSTQLRQLNGKDWLACWEIPFLFNDRNHVEKYINSEHSKKMLKTLETDNLLPLTYSYAGGFCSILKKRNSAVDNFNHLDFKIQDYEPTQMEEADCISLYASLPFNILMYELHDVTELPEHLKSVISVELTNHVLTSRITLISKKKLAEIPEQYRDDFLSILKGILDEERHVIYDRADRNTALVKADPALEIVDWGLGKRHGKYLEVFPKVVSDDLAEEIDFISSIWE